MTKADELNLTNLMDNVRKMENAMKNDNENEIAKIRQYCIDAVRDYNETNKKICDLINANRDLWKNPYIKGSYDGFVNGTPYRLSKYDFFGCNCPFVFTTGKFSFGNGMYVSVSGISGRKARTGYCGSFEDHDIVSKDWVADSIILENEWNGNTMPWHNDLIESTFDKKLTDGTLLRGLKFTEENLRNASWSIEGWVDIKNRAEKTRKRTEGLVRLFKEALEKRIQNSTEKLNKLTSSSETSVYVKVQF